jgi:outer membrane murein-binding lipoprotein Lpp
MRRAAVALAVLALAGCGHEQKKDAQKAVEGARKHAKHAKDQVDKAIEDIKKSDLPKDAQKELEEAKELLDKGY